MRVDIKVSKELPSAIILHAEGRAFYVTMEEFEHYFRRLTEGKDGWDLCDDPYEKYNLVHYNLFSWR